MKTKHKPVHISLLFHATCGRLYTSIIFQNEPVNRYLLPPFLGYLDKWSIDMTTHHPLSPVAMKTNGWYYLLASDRL